MVLKKINIGVIGVGNLGQHHLRIYNELKEQVNLVGIVDTDKSKLEKYKKLYNIETFSNYKEILDKIDAVSLVVPTNLHYEIAREILNAGKHILIEKPITSTVEEAEHLIDIAKKNNLILQVGHVERFNPSVMVIREHINKPKFIEALRLGCYDPRVSDIGVVLDLMIHDIDIILSFISANLKSVEAYGAKVFSDKEDIVKARLRFDNGCICDLTASRISTSRYRSIRIFEENKYISLNLLRQQTKIYQKKKPDVTSPADIEIIKPKINRTEPLKLELEHFIESIYQNKKPIVTGEHARDALNIAVEILRQLKY